MNLCQDEKRWGLAHLKWSWKVLRINWSSKLSAHQSCREARENIKHRYHLVQWNSSNSSEMFQTQHEPLEADKFIEIQQLSPLILSRQLANKQLVNFRHAILTLPKVSRPICLVPFLGRHCFYALLTLLCKIKIWGLTDIHWSPQVNLCGICILTSTSIAEYLQADYAAYNQPTVFPPCNHEKMIFCIKAIIFIWQVKLAEHGCCRSN